jgi:LPXTG-motif cell wall-anchored protein
MGTAKIYTALLLAIPVLISAVGAILIIRRKNR